uniref:InlB B-repeat-containing protein n=1 Tax=Treponema lecithinolyticum TaxID=53418 RepID=UPI0028ED035B
MTKFKTQKNKAFAFWGAAFVLFIAVFTGCPQTADGGNTNGAGKPEIKPKHIVSFSVDGAGGTLKAKADGVTETGTSPVTVEQDKIVTFTAAPAAGYKLKEWKVDGTVISNTSNTYTHSVTTAVDVKVSFQLLPPGKIELTLSPDKLTIKVAAITADSTHVTVEGCTETTFASGGTYTELHARGTTVTLKGNIIKLDFGDYNYNKLTALNAQDCAALQKLNCSRNTLTALNVQGCTALQELDCCWNKLTSLNVQGLTALQKLDCGDNYRLTSLNVQGLSDLQVLYCGSNKLTELNVQGLSNLQALGCGSNKLTELNVQGLNDLRVLDFGSNQITAIDVQSFSNLRELYCHGNPLADFNIQSLSNLQKLSCGGLPLSTLNLQGLSNLRELYCGVGQLTSLDVQGLSALQTLDCRDNQLTALNVQGCTSLQSLSCYNNQLAALDIHDLNALKWLFCFANRLTAEAFTKIFTDLPQRDAVDAARCFLCVESTGI